MQRQKTAKIDKLLGPESHHADPCLNSTCMLVQLQSCQVSRLHLTRFCRLSRTNTNTCHHSHWQLTWWSTPHTHQRHLCSVIYTSTAATTQTGRDTVNKQQLGLADVSYTL